MEKEEKSSSKEKSKEEKSSSKEKSKEKEEKSSSKEKSKEKEEKSASKEKAKEEQKSKEKSKEKKKKKDDDVEERAAEEDKIEAEKKEEENVVVEETGPEGGDAEDAEKNADAAAKDDDADAKEAPDDDAPAPDDADAAPDDADGAPDDADAAPDNPDEEDSAYKGLRPSSYRLPFENSEQRKEAKNRQKKFRLKKMITENGELLKWRQATPDSIGVATSSVGIKLYFLFLKSGACYLGIWAVATVWSLFIYVLPSPLDARWELGLFAQLSMASYGDQDISKNPAERKAMGTEMSSLSPVLAVFSAWGALVFFLWAWHFEVRVISKAEEELDQAAVTPADFTVIVDCLILSRNYLI